MISNNWYSTRVGVTVIVGVGVVVGVTVGVVVEVGCVVGLVVGLTVGIAVGATVGTTTAFIVYIPLVEPDPIDTPSPIISTPEKPIDPEPALSALTDIVNSDLFDVVQDVIPNKKCGLEQVGDDCTTRSSATLML
jgi:hypothetical protein